MVVILRFDQFYLVIAIFSMIRKCFIIIPILFAKENLISIKSQKKYFINTHCLIEKFNIQKISSMRLKQLNFKESKRADVIYAKCKRAYRSEEHTSELQSRGHLV